MTTYSNKRNGTSVSGRYVMPVLVFSFVINALYLVGPIFMMQVYDRVLSSGSFPTLFALSLIAGVLFVFFGIMDHIRTQLLEARAESFAQNLAQRAFDQSLQGYALDNPTSKRRNAVEDVSTVRQFLASSGFTALNDIIWMPIFLAFIFAMHSILGITAIIAALVLTVLAIINERLCRTGMTQSTQLQKQAQQWAGQAHRQAANIVGNGMQNATTQQWLNQEQVARRSSHKVSSRSSLFRSITKTSRMMVQSLILAIGAYLAIKGEMSAGAMIAASIIFSRTLAPIEQLLGQFPLLLRARDAWGRIKTWRTVQAIEQKIDMPAPTKDLSVLISSLTPPDAQNVVLQKVQMKLKAGDVVGIIGPSGGGKSSLAKALCGAWAPQQGMINLDGVDLREWPRHQLSAAIGYMPQDCQLFDGSIAQNIAGFRDDVDSQDILAACIQAGAHDLIMAMPNSYNTKVGPNGHQISAGQRQRIGLARALFGNPFLVILDEPNSNLDEEGEKALAHAISLLKQTGKIVVVIAHRQRVLQQATHLCKIDKGVMAIFGPKLAVQKRLSVNAKTKKTAQQTKAQTPSKTTTPPHPNSEPAGTSANPYAAKPKDLPPMPTVVPAPAIVAASQTPAPYARAQNS